MDTSQNLATPFQSIIITPMRKAPWLFLAIWLLGILFPAACLGQFSSLYRGVFTEAFGPEWRHVIAHLLMYAVLCILIVVMLKWPARPEALTPWLALGLIGVVLAVGIAQESLQWLSQGVTPWQGEALAASLYDLGIDLSGGLLGVGMVHLWRVYHPQ